MAGGPLGVRIDGVRELVRAIGKVDSSYRKEIGQANKGIGQRIIDKAYPTATPGAVGASTGAKARASATTTSLRVIVGGAHRKHRFQQWGKRVVNPPRSGRPYLRRSAEQDMKQIEKDYLAVLLNAARKAGLKTEK